jgi:hypothetical protein
MNNHVVDGALEVTRMRNLVATVHRVKLFGFLVSPENADYDDTLRSRGENLFVGECQSLRTCVPGFLSGTLEPSRWI